MRKFYLFIKFLFYGFLLLIVAGIVGGYAVYRHFAADLPKLDSLKDYAPPVMSEVFAADGSKIGEFWGDERRIVLKPDDIPDLIKKAIIATEDQTFREHKGIDYFGIVRAFFENLKAGHTVQGGSTITQQVVKTFVLGSERSYERKIKEAILATRLEETFGKDEILYLYLNQIYFGNRAAGVEAAAQNYFHKTAKELSIAEAAMLAGLPKAPSMFSPLKNMERAKARQRYVIERMYDEDYITKQQRDKALKEELKIYVAPLDKEYNMRIAPWFVEEVRRMIIEKYGEQVPYTHGLKIYTTLDLKAQAAADKAVWRGLVELHKRHGYNGPVRKISSTEFGDFHSQTHKKLFLAGQEKDLLQAFTAEQIEAGAVTLEKNKIYEGVVTAIDEKLKTATVQVGHLAGTIMSKDFGWARKRANMAHGYDGTQYVSSPKQVFTLGDVIEVKLVDTSVSSKSYAVGTTYFSLEQAPQVEGALFSYEPQTGFVKAIFGGKDYAKGEFNRATQAVRQTGSVFKPLLYSAALDKGFTPQDIIEDSPIPSNSPPFDKWQPQNYGGGYKGPTSFHSALVYSRNVVSVKILINIGVNFETAFIRKLGFTTPIAKYYSMALGANDMRLMEVARAFGVFPTGGILPDLIFIKKITDRFGTIIEENQPKVVQGFLEQIKGGEHEQMTLASKDPDDVGKNLRPDLWSAAQDWIEKDKLDLTPYEKVLLYGKYLPEGYVLSPKTAYTMVKLMRDIVTMGTGTRVAALKRPAAGKTGTTNDLTDCWFVGYVPDLVAGVWTGYDENKNKVGGGETGGKAAAPIFLYYMQNYLEGTPVKDFDIPENLEIAAILPPANVYPFEDNSDILLNSGPQGGGGADFFINDF